MPQYRTGAGMTPTVLVAGIGNVFLGDDAFGVETVHELMARGISSEVALRDFGIRGFDLAYALLEPWDTVIMVDALPRNEAPGTLFLLEPELDKMPTSEAEGVDLNPHGMDPVRVLHLAASLGRIAAQVLVVGCEPQDFGDELEGRMGLSEPVQAAIPEACRMIEQLIERLLSARLESVHEPSAELNIMER